MSLYWLITRSSGLDEARQGRIVGLSWQEVIKRNPVMKAEAVSVHDAAGKTLISQAVDENGDGICDTLLVHADFAPGKTANCRSFRASQVLPKAGAWYM